VNPREDLGRIQRHRLAGIVETPPDNRHDVAIAFGQCCVHERWLRLKSAGVDKHDLVPEHAIDPKDVLHRSKEDKILNRGSNFLIHLAHDRVSVRLAEVHTATDQPVVALRVLLRRRIDSDGVPGEIVVRGYEHRLHPDEGSIYGHGHRVDIGSTTRRSVIGILDAATPYLRQVSRSGGRYLHSVSTAEGDPVAALLVTGTVGVGKTTVAEAVGDVLASRSVPHAVIDLDQLRTSWPAPAGDPFNSAIELRNLASVAANYRAVGARKFVLAGVIERRADRALYEKALDTSVTVVRLRTARRVLDARLRHRHIVDPVRLTWHLNRASELDRILDHSHVADMDVDIGERQAVVVAREVLAEIGW
jgi:adenylylsulfate kinase